MTKLSPAKAEELLRARFRAAMERVTPESIAGQHEYQRKVLACKSANIICMCSRRAGKSEIACGLLLLTAAATDNVSCLFLGLTRESSGTIWRKFKRMLKRLKLSSMVAMTESDQLAILPNGSRIMFSGSDDTRRITHLLGDSFAGGMAVLDEMQSDPGIAKILVEDILGPMLDETVDGIDKPGRLVMLGTVPDVPAGYLYQTWERNYTGPSTVPGYSESDDWGCFAWSRFDNPFEVDNEARLEAYCRKYKFEVTDPELRRRWFGERVFSKDSNCYRFVPSKHTYTPSSCERISIGPFQSAFASVMPGLRHYIVGIDQAQRTDRFAIIAWGWNPAEKDKLWHVAEAVTAFGADPQDSEWLEVCKELRKRYPGSMEFIRDAGGSSAPVNDALQLSHGITVVSAIKGPGSLKARVQRLADLFQRGVAKVMSGSELEQDLITTRWSIAARERGKWEFDKSAKSPDLSDAATYALDLPSFTTRGAQPKQHKPGSEDEWLREQQAKTLRDLLSGKPQAKPRANPALAMWNPPPRQ